MKKNYAFLLATLLLTPSVLAGAVPRIDIQAMDRQRAPLEGFRFSYEGERTRPTLDTGTTSLELPPNHEVGRRISLLLLSSSEPEWDWFLVDPEVNIPAENTSATVVLMRRREFRDLAAEARDASARIESGSAGGGVLSTKQALLQTAEEYGLTPEQLEAAVESFGKTEDPKDQGISLFLEGELGKAEVLFEEAAAAKEEDLVETLRYLGATQYGQAKYEAAIGTFRKAVALAPENTTILSWLGSALDEMAAWEEAEEVKRRALELDLEALGPGHPSVATDLNNLAQLLQDTNRLEEAEPLMKRALEIDTKAFGDDHPNVAIRLNNLAQLLKDTNRLEEAEPLMRRSLAILVKSSRRNGYAHPNHQVVLANYILLLQEKGVNEGAIETEVQNLIQEVVKDLSSE